jgi:CRISPR-associated endonuclease Csn1
MAELEHTPYVLGIDLGTNSVGWALVRLENGVPAGIIRAGSRVFEAGMEGTAADFESGKEESRNAKRRQMRLQRRQAWRRARRLKKIFGLLQTFGLLPQGKSSTPEERQKILETLDKEILTSDWFNNKAATVPEPHQVMPYLLRTAALDDKTGASLSGPRALPSGAASGLLEQSQRVQLGRRQEVGER